MTELLKFQKAKLTRAARKYKEEHGIEFELTFDLRGASAGQVRYNYVSKIAKLRLNMGFLEHNFDAILGQTLPHEIAHIMALVRYGRNGGGHGKAWKEMMNLLGKPADRLHKMDKSTIYKDKIYCDCQTHPVSKIMWNKVARGQERRCVKCDTQVSTKPRPNQK